MINIVERIFIMDDKEIKLPDEMEKEFNNGLGDEEE